jgi:hypothetical protein
MTTILDHEAAATALFASPVQVNDHPSRHQIRVAIRCYVRRFGTCECVSRMAKEFGDHPEEAAARMRWATACTCPSLRARLTIWSYRQMRQARNWVNRGLHRMNARV